MDVIVSTVKQKIQLARENWQRYTSAMERGHWDWQKQAMKNEDFYLGGGRQWDSAVTSALEQMGKPWLEENVIFSTVNTVLGYQTQSRMDIAFKPREAGDQATSDILTKLAMYVVDKNQFGWQESQVFADGLIQGRGYFDIRMEFDENINGDVRITSLDPLDVIPDPDGKSYDPSDWEDVIVTKWIPLEDIKIMYGLSKYREVVRMQGKMNEADFGSDGFGVERNKFAADRTYNSFSTDEADVDYVRVLERQWYKLTKRKAWYEIGTGEIFYIPDSMTDAEAKKIAKQNDYEIIDRTIKRIRWTVSTKDVILHDDWSPYDNFTVVPFFPYFRRGKTVGMIDNLIKTQEMLNKTYSQILHVINTTANSGWTVEENTLVNMEVEDLEERGGETGLVLEYKAGRTAPQKIEPNQIPTGLKDMITSGVELIRLISGVSETFQGGKGPEVSGTAIQSRVQQAAVQLATPIDNLFRTRNMIGNILLKLIQSFYTTERTFLIAEDDYKPNGEGPQSITINQEDQDTGQIINDVTVGKYDVVVADVPTQITFQNSQFQQAIEMRKYGIQIPDDEMVKMSTLARKNEIAKKMAGEPGEEQQRQMEEQYQLQIQQMQKTIEKLESESNKSNMAAAKSASDIAVAIAQNPGIAPLIDSFLQQYTEQQDEQMPENEEYLQNQEPNATMMGQQGLGAF